MKIINSLIKSWILPEPIDKKYNSNINIDYILQRVLIRRGIDLEEELDIFIKPSFLPKAEQHFPELDKASNRIIEACKKKQKIAVCGDYDADGMTSTVLLVEVLSILGGDIIPYIPSRKEDGYGLNIKMINAININNIKLIITVDNGISAIKAIEKANEFNIDLIITDHHKIPINKPKIFALVHPEMTPVNSPYKYLAGVGIAYMIAKSICKKTNVNIENSSAIELFCIGTVADMAPLVGANRMWLKDGLTKFKSTKNKGLIAIIKKLGISQSSITTEEIGYKIAPLINAVGRIGEPQLAIKLLTSKSEILCKELTNICMETNKERRRITDETVKEAINYIENNIETQPNFLVISKDNWHGGIIGIVAARLLEKFNTPTAILGGKEDGLYRGSVRSNNLLKVNEALKECSDLLESYGGHSAAGGFSIKEENIPILNDTLNKIAMRDLVRLDNSKSIYPDAHLDFDNINYDFYNQLESIGPYGIKNPRPVFWTRNCTILEIYKLKGTHIKLKLDQKSTIIEAIKWNNLDIINIKDKIDIAYYLEINRWKQKTKLQINILAIKKYNDVIDLVLHEKLYKCCLLDDQKIKISNEKGEFITSNDLKHLKRNKTHKIFFTKLFSFAEIALGVAA